MSKGPANVCGNNHNTTIVFIYEYLWNSYCISSTLILRGSLQGNRIPCIQEWTLENSFLPNVLIQGLTGWFHPLLLSLPPALLAAEGRSTLRCGSSWVLPRWHYLVSIILITFQVCMKGTIAPTAQMGRLRLAPLSKSCKGTHFSYMPCYLSKTHRIITARRVCSMLSLGIRGPLNGRQWL